MGPLRKIKSHTSGERAKDGGGKGAILVRENFIKKRMEGKKINGIFQK